jgi:hypothetical protein
MAAFDHDKIQEMRTMENWSELQEDDHHRQMRIAKFILSLARVANDLQALRHSYSIIHSARASTQAQVQGSFNARQAMDELEFMIRQHSIQTFGKDIFLPGDPTELRSPTLPPEGPQQTVEKP